MLLCTEWIFHEIFPDFSSLYFMIYALKCQVVLPSETTEFLVSWCKRFHYFSPRCVYLSKKTREWFWVWITKIPCRNCSFSGSHKDGVTWVCFPIWLPAGSLHSMLTSSLITVILNTFTSIRKNSGWMRSRLLTNFQGQKESVYISQARTVQSILS